MTEQNERAARVWREALEAGQQDWPKPIDDRAAAAVIAREFEALEAENARLRRNVKGWVEWHRRCDADDDCTYLNDNAWCDAEALASTGMGLLARASLGASHDADA